MTLDYTEIGKRIARRRKELGLKQSEVEEKKQTSVTSISLTSNAAFLFLPSRLSCVLLWLWIRLRMNF